MNNVDTCFVQPKTNAALTMNHEKNIMQQRPSVHSFFSSGKIEKKNAGFPDNFKEGWVAV